MYEGACTSERSGLLKWNFVGYEGLKCCKSAHCMGSHVIVWSGNIRLGESALFASQVTRDVRLIPSRRGEDDRKWPVVGDFPDGVVAHTNVFDKEGGTSTCYMVDNAGARRTVIGGSGRVWDEIVGIVKEYA